LFFAWNRCVLIQWRTFSHYFITPKISASGIHRFYCSENYLIFCRSIIFVQEMCVPNMLSIWLIFLAQKKRASGHANGKLSLVILIKMCYLICVRAEQKNVHQEILKILFWQILRASVFIDCASCFLDTRAYAFSYIQHFS
jgi:hypothetical protein